MRDLRHVRSRLWRRVLAFIISGVIHGVSGFLGRVFVLTGACLSKIELRNHTVDILPRNLSHVSLLDAN